EAEAYVGIIIAQGGAGKQQDTGFCDELLAVGGGGGGVDADEGHGACLGAAPGEEVVVAGEEISGEGQVGFDEAAAARDEGVVGAQGGEGQEFAGGRGADGGVMFPVDETVSHVGIMNDQP